MEHANVLERLGITDAWINVFVTESNLIDPDPSPSIPGTPVYDNHRDALLYALYTAAEDRYALPNEVYKLLSRGVLGQGLRTQEVEVGGLRAMPPQLIKRELFLWNRRANQTIDSLRTDDHSIPEERRRSEIWGLHCELVNIRPYDHYNGKVGRILMVNHALLTDTQPWVVPSQGRQEYVDTIRKHPSSSWGINPPNCDQL